jgi:hypothetical protein
MSTDGPDRLNAALAGRYAIEREIERGESDSPVRFGSFSEGR